MLKFFLNLFFLSIISLPAKAIYYASQFNDQFRTGFVYEDGGLIGQLMSPIKRLQLNSKIANLEVHGFLLESKYFDKAISISFGNTYSHIFQVDLGVKVRVPLLATRVVVYDRIDSTICTPNEMSKMTAASRMLDCYAKQSRNPEHKVAFRAHLWDFNYDRDDLWSNLSKFTLDGAGAAAKAIMKEAWVNRMALVDVVLKNQLYPDYWTGSQALRGGSHFKSFLAETLLYRNGFGRDLASETGWSKRGSSNRSQDVKNDEGKILDLIRKLKDRKQVLIMPTSECRLNGNLIVDPILVTEAESKNLKCPEIQIESDSDFFEIDEIKSAAERLGF